MIVFFFYQLQIWCDSGHERQQWFLYQHTEYATLQSKTL